MPRFKETYWYSVCKIWGIRTARRSQFWWRMLGYVFIVFSLPILLIGLVNCGRNHNLVDFVLTILLSVMFVLFGVAIIRLVDIDLDEVESHLNKNEKKNEKGEERNLGNLIL